MKPIKPLSVSRGNKSAFATPIRAVAAASSRSAARTSGRRRSRSSGESDGERREVRRHVVRRELGVESPGLLTDQDREPVRRRRLGSNQRRNARFGRREPRGRARDVELAAAAEVEPHAREAQRLALRVEIRARDREPLLSAAQVEVRARDLGRDEHLRVAQIRFRRLRVGARGLRAAPHAPEQIELPERRDADLVRLDRDSIRREPGLLLVALVVRDRDVHAGPAFAARRAQQRARFLDTRSRDFEIEIARERALDQGVERRITELLPPRRLERLRLDDGRIGVAKLGGLASPEAGSSARRHTRRAAAWTWPTAMLCS